MGIEHWDEKVLGKLSPAKRKRLEALGELVDRDLNADRRFFKRRPERTCFIRRAFKSEIEQHVILDAWKPLPAGLRHFVIVRQLQPGARMRLFIIGTAQNETDLGEAEALALLNRARASREPLISTMEQVLRGVPPDTKG